MVLATPNPVAVTYRLMEPYDDARARVPPGFEWDGASIPRAGWTALGITPYHPRVLRASLVHDWLYRQREGTRESADESFYRVLREDGLDAARALVMWRAVRRFGGLTWPDGRAVASLDDPPDDGLPV